MTRLLVRARAGRGYIVHGMPWWLARRIVPLVHFVMQRKQLLGIARRAESTPPTRIDTTGQLSEERTAVA